MPYLTGTDMQQHVLQVLSDNRIWELHRIYNEIENMNILNQHGRNGDKVQIPTGPNNFEPRYQNSVRQALRQLNKQKIERVGRGLVRLIPNANLINEFEDEDEVENEFEDDYLRLRINKDVERKAVEIVTRKLKNEKWLENKKWTVESKELEKIGYDLHCTAGNCTIFVEVKGKSGQDNSFIITKNERAKTRQNPTSFYLVVVTSALTQNPKIEYFRGDDLEKKFDFEPLAYAAKLKR